MRYAIVCDVNEDYAMPRPTIFLDIDGVLNGHEYDDICESNTIQPEPRKWLNHIIRETDAEIVLSSAWRYMVLGEAMTLRGFEYLLRTHGVECLGRLIGHTCSDEEVLPRGQQIREWLNRNGGDRRYVVIDDGGTENGEWSDLGINSAGHPAVWTDGGVGLTQDDAAKVIALLTRETP